MFDILNNAYLLIDIKGSEKSILVYLVYRANKRGIAYPSISTIAKQTGFSERTVKRSIKKLESKGLFKIDHGNRSRSNRYYFNIDHYKEIVDALKVIN